MRKRLRHNQKYEGRARPGGHTATGVPSSHGRPGANVASLACDGSKLQRLLDQHMRTGKGPCALWVGLEIGVSAVEKCGARSKNYNPAIPPLGILSKKTKKLI